MASYNIHNTFEIKFAENAIAYAQNGTFLNDPIIKERIDYIRRCGTDSPSTHTHDNPSLVGNSDSKYFKVASVVTYASGICVKKYNENKL